LCTLARDGVSKSNGLNQCDGWFSLYHFVTDFVIAIWVPSLGWLEQQTITITNVVFSQFL